MAQNHLFKGGAGVEDATITAADLAADSVDSSEIATGAVDPDHIAGLADTAATVRVVTPLLLRLEFDSADFDANDDLTVTFPSGHAVQIHDVWCIYTTAEGGPLTITMRDTANGGGAALTGTIDLNTTTDALIRPSTIDLSAATVSAGGSVYMNASANPGTVADARLYILYSHTT